MVSYGRYHAAAATFRLHVFLWPPAEQERNMSDHSFAIPEDETCPRPAAREIEGQPLPGTVTLTPTRCQGHGTRPILQHTYNAAIPPVLSAAAWWPVSVSHL